MRAKATFLSQVGIMGSALALSFLASAEVAAQNPKQMTPELQKVREALDKYQDPVMAIHDGYFSTLGCVEYLKPGTVGQVPYPGGGMGAHFFNVMLMGTLDPLSA
jgi:hypothetical protein